MKNKILEYFNGSELAAKVWEDKYKAEGEKTPDDMHKRMAKEFARIEQNYPDPASEQNIYESFKDFKYIIPQGSIMSGLGTGKNVSLSNCTVLPKIPDSFGGIHKVDEMMSQLFKRRCGVGIDISTLRPNLSKVNNAAGTSSGAVSFMNRFSNTTLEVAQSGRRGALMISIDIRHPDAMEFITIKSDLTKITGANISVRLDDAFMEAVVKNTKVDQKFNGKVIGVIAAKKLWDAIVFQAHSFAEPGLLFWDRQHWYSTSSVYPEYENVSTNPCSEIGMGGSDSCRLIALNLLGFVDNPFTTRAIFNYSKFEKYNKLATRLNDDLVDLEVESIDRIIKSIQNSPEEDNVKATELYMWSEFKRVGLAGRRIGLGFTALGDTLAALNLKYDGEEALKIVDTIMRSKLKSEFEESISLGKSRGVFAGFNAKVEKTSHFVQMMEREFPELTIDMMKHGRRNISISTVAPTGSLSILAGTTSGIEPLFAPYYVRRKKVTDGEVVDFIDDTGNKWKNHPIIHETFKKWLIVKGAYSEEITPSELQLLFKESPWFGSTANDIDWIKRVEIQSIIQKYITHSISSTINLPNDVSLSVVNDIYIESWKRGLKGITVYRDGSRSGVLVLDDTTPVNKSGRPDIITRHAAPSRPPELNCDIHVLTAKGIKYNVLVGKLKEEPYEVFAFEYDADISKVEVGILEKKNKGIYNLITKLATYEGVNNRIETDEEIAITRMISTALRHGAEMTYVVEQLQKSNGTIVSFTKAIARVLKKYSNSRIKKVSCPECGSTNYVMENGCSVCHDCGHSGCS